MKALKSHPHIERPRRINSQITLAKYTAGLVLALVGLIGAALMKGPIQPASAETVALGWSYTDFIRLSRVLWLSVLVVMLGRLLEPEAAAQTVSFGAKTDFGTGDRPHSVAVGDFNGDGKLDLAVANFDSNTVSILLGTGTGSFGAKTDFGTGRGSNSVAVGDFNGDGKLDLVAASGGATVSILLGTGTGSFGAKTDFGTGGAYSVAVGDFNGDGTLDLAVANGDSATVSILLGTGTGSFGAKTDFGTGIGPASVAVGDFNGDGRLDLAVANQRSNTVSILLNTGPTGPGCSNPIDRPDAFVRQHYLDFLNRQADDLGLAFWTNEITSCGADPQCIEYKRIMSRQLSTCRLNFRALVISSSEFTRQLMGTRLGRRPLAERIRSPYQSYG